jgi:hypothetical protein
MEYSSRVSRLKFCVLFFYIFMRAISDPPQPPDHTRITNCGTAAPHIYTAFGIENRPHSPMSEKPTAEEHYQMRYRTSRSEIYLFG